MKQHDRILALGLCQSNGHGYSVFVATKETLEYNKALKAAKNLSI